MEGEEALTPGGWQAERDLQKHSQESRCFSCRGSCPSPERAKPGQDSTRSVTLSSGAHIMLVSEIGTIPAECSACGRAISKDGKLLGYSSLHFQFSEYNLNVGRQADRQITQWLYQ